MEHHTDRAVYSIKEVSSMLRINTGLAYQLVKCGLLPAIKLGSLKVRKAALDDFLVRYEGYDLNDLTDIHLLNFVS